MVKSIKYMFLGCVLCLAAIAGPVMAADTDETAAAPEKITTSSSSTAEVCALDIGRATGEVFFPLGEESNFESDGPSSMAVDKDGKIYILDTFNFRVLVVAGGRVVKTISYPECETKSKKYFGRDLAVSHDGKSIYILNHTAKNIFIYSNEGILTGTVNLAEEIAGPHKIFVTPAGDIAVRDEEGPAVAIYSKDGKLKSVTEGAYTANILNGEGYLYALGEFDDNGRDIILVDPVGARNARPYARIVNTVAKMTAFDYQIIGVDSDLNLYALVVEQPQFDVSRPVITKFDKNGKTVSRFTIPNFFGLGTALPARQYAISPSGGFYAFELGPGAKKFFVYKITESK